MSKSVFVDSFEIRPPIRSGVFSKRCCPNPNSNSQGRCRLLTRVHAQLHLMAVRGIAASKLKPFDAYV